MICCMPFTYLDDRYLRKLTGALGSVSIYAPAPGILPDPMLHRAQDGFIDLRYPHGVDSRDLLRALAEFKAWADLHRGDIADMAAFFKSRSGHPPLYDETNPTAIGNLVRNFGRQDKPGQDDSTFRAALFLAMAQEFDQQQDAVEQDLGAVTSMERDMLAGLAGKTPEMPEGFDAKASPTDPMDRGAFMTDRRLQAWAEIAGMGSRPEPFSLYVTPSPAVLQYLLDRWPHYRGPYRAALKIDDTHKGESNSEVLKILKDLAFKQDDAAWQDDIGREISAEDCSTDLIFYILAGIQPDRFVNRLAGEDSATDQCEPSSPGSGNTLIGILDR